MKDKKIKIIEIHADSKEDALRQISEHVEKLGLKKGEFEISDGNAIASGKVESPFVASPKLSAKDIMKEIESALGDIEDPKKYKVVSSHPITKDEKKLWNELIKVSEEHKKIEKLHNHAKSKFWKTVELRLNEFDKHLRFNDKTDEVEIVEDVD